MDIPARPARELAAALLLAGLLTLAWTVRGWADLSLLRLPDTDDMVRLQQIRDWIGGQAFGDLAQHRLGMAPGLEMHWSRLPDLVPAATIMGLTPLLGAQTATLAAVILWPALLFAFALMLIAAIARALGTSGPLAALIAALAYPATTLFMPGRIDHHGLQLVLLLFVARAVVGPGTFAAGAGAGIASAASLAIGIETAPLLAIGGAAIVIRWIVDDREGQLGFSGYAVALALALALASLLLRTTGWNWPACDGFTATLWRAAQFASLAPLALAIFAIRSPELKARLLASAVAATVAAGGALWLSPECLRPYGAVDPLLARLWLANVGEAQPMFAAPMVHVIGYAGLMLTGIGASLWAWRTSRDARWLDLLSLQLAALALTFIQLRGAHAGALLAAPALAALIAHARGQSAALLVPAWLISAGLLYPVAAAAFAPRANAPAVASADCTTPAALKRLAALPPGTLMAPIDMGAYALTATPHRVVAAPYHRNSAGNLAMYRFFLGSSEEARAIADEWKISYVALCPGDFAELGARSKGASQLNTLLRGSNPPSWLRPLSRPGEVPALFEVTLQARP